MTTGSKLDLLEGVQTLLLPRVAALGLTLVSHQESDSFDNADVTLRSGNVVARVYRERSIVFLDLASTHTPHKFFDSSLVMDYLGLSKDAGFHSRDLDTVLGGIASFLVAFWQHLSSAFGSENVIQTNTDLAALAKKRDAERWGA
jgi:hypothetical protein